MLVCYQCLIHRASYRDICSQFNKASREHYDSHNDSLINSEDVVISRVCFPHCSLVKLRLYDICYHNILMQVSHSAIYYT